MIIFDTETTALLKPAVADLASQPHIIEFAVLKVDESYNEIDRITTLLKPPIPINEEEHAKITGLKNADLADAPTFVEMYDQFAAFFLGESTLVCHNLEFDLGMLVVELRRISKEFAFPYPYNQVCTVVATKHLNGGKRLKLTELYELKLKRKLLQTHRAMDDVLALAEVVKEMRIT